MHCERTEMTLFSEAKHKFLPVSEGEDIPTQLFLNACSEIVPFFGSNSVFTVLYTFLGHFIADVLGSTAFMPVKADINGNIQVYITCYMYV